jgi:hypothetical protein
MDVMVVVERQPDLFQVVRALPAPRGFTSLLHCRQQQCNQDSDDGDRHQ